MKKLTPMTVVMALVAAAAFVAKVKYGFHSGN
jgi:hypothetical protein